MVFGFMHVYNIICAYMEKSDLSVPTDILFLEGDLRVEFNPHSHILLT